MVQEIKDYARSLVEVLAREQSRDVSIFMKDRFVNVLYHDTDSRPNVWTDQREDIGTITRDACSAALKVLSVMAAIRLTERPDTISHSLFSSLTVDPSSQDITTIDPLTHPLALTTWEEVSLENTLIPQVGCLLFWKRFLQWTRAFDHAASICDAQNRATHARPLENGPSPSPSPSGPWRLPGWSNSAFQVVKDLAAVALIAAEGSPHRRTVKIICKILDVLNKVAERPDLL